MIQSKENEFKKKLKETENQKKNDLKVKMEAA
jgi:hypothetical protein